MSLSTRASYVDIGSSRGSMSTGIGLPRISYGFSVCGELLPKTSLHFGCALFCALLRASNYRCLLLLLVLADFQFPSAVFVLLRSSSLLACSAFILFSTSFSAYFIVSPLFLLSLACAACCIVKSIHFAQVIADDLYQHHTQILRLRGREMYPRVG